MSLTRFIVAFCALSVASPVPWTAADDTNFTNWQRKVAGDTSQNPAAASRPQFFSPNTATSADDDAANADGQQRQRMRLVDSASEAAGSTAMTAKTSDSATVGPTITLDHPQWPSSPRSAQEDMVATPLLTRKKPHQPGSLTVTSAEFQTTTGGSSGIVPAGMTGSQDNGSSEESFSTFLQREEASQQSPELPSLPLLEEAAEFSSAVEIPYADTAPPTHAPQFEDSIQYPATAGDTTETRPSSRAALNPFPVSLPSATVQPQTAGMDAPTRPASFSRPSPFREAFDNKSFGRQAGHTVMTPVPAASRTANGPTTTQVRLSWKAVDDLNVGQTCRCELLVVNEGSSRVQQVVVDARLPANVELVAASPEPKPGAGGLSWTFEALEAGEQKSIQLELIPQERGDVRAEASVRFSGYSGSTLTVHEPKIDVDVSGPTRVAVGEQAGYVVRVSNPGTGTARNVVIQAAIPEGLEHRSGKRLVIDVGTLAAGESRQARLTLTAVKGGPQQIAVRTNSDAGLTAEASASLTVAAPELQIAMDTDAERSVGEVAELVLTVSNTGDVASANARAKYRLPVGFDFVRADGGGRFDASSRTVEWFVGTIAPGEEAYFTVRLNPTAAGTSTHSAGIISELGAVTMVNRDMSVQGVARLEVESKVAAASVPQGGENTYEIRVSSTGSRPATNVGVSCELPAGAKFVAAAGPTEYIAENGVIVFRSMPELQAGQSVIYNVRIRCERAGTQQLRTRVASETVSEPVIDEVATTVQP